jgi:hypothetical protein
MLLNESAKKIIQKNRRESIGSEITFKDHILHEIDLLELSFVDGEVESAIDLRGRKLKRGMVIKVNTRYTGSGIAVICGFSFHGKNFPIIISQGGAEGEIIACVQPSEISLFPTQRECEHAFYLKDVKKV